MSKEAFIAYNCPTKRAVDDIVPDVTRSIKPSSRSGRAAPAALIVRRWSDAARK